MKLHEYFDRIVIINLPSRTDRKEEMLSELEKIGIAENSSKLSFFAAIRPNTADGFPSIGAKGCFLSHLEILKAAERDGINRLLILEDDLSFSKQLIDDEDAIINVLEHMHWDLAYLGHVIPEHIDSSTFFQEYKKPIRCTHFMAFQKAGIAISAKSLEKILNRPPGHPLGGPMHVDGAYSTLREQNPEMITVVAVPSFGAQRSSISDITSTSWYNNVPILRDVLQPLRRLKNWYANI